MKTLNRPDHNELKVYLPIDKRSKANVRGFWRGSQGLCYDYIQQTRARIDSLDSLKREHKQECLFYTRQSKAYIWHNSKNIEELKHYRYFEYNRHSRGLKVFLKDILKTYGGFTIYVREQDYLVEVWI